MAGFILGTLISGVRRSSGGNQKLDRPDANLSDEDGKEWITVSAILEGLPRLVEQTMLFNLHAVMVGLAATDGMRRSGII